MPEKVNSTDDVYNQIVTANVSLSALHVNKNVEKKFSKLVTDIFSQYNLNPRVIKGENDGQTHLIIEGPVHTIWKVLKKCQHDIHGIGFHKLETRVQLTTKPKGKANLSSSKGSSELKAKHSKANELKEKSDSKDKKLRSKGKGVFEDHKDESGASTEHVEEDSQEDDKPRVSQQKENEQGLHSPNLTEHQNERNKKKSPTVFDSHSSEGLKPMCKDHKKSEDLTSQTHITATVQHVQHDKDTANSKNPGKKVTRTVVHATIKHKNDTFGKGKHPDIVIYYNTQAKHQ